ncbi:vWA domain-containing protein [Paenibacillus arenilitoris]|uniref:Nitric oxide reductase activation protein NorD n=1 Tax=Paenibacillus arenilitoris TaxID=2772299 RepID=A0A927CRY6_9BACL|nr:nitric oxide reductase activation protein NorD [Paenibacillus arenilitoris]MBD2871116.1 nitric oxide reductase activation protein NorD [Paenibacillus arenilitoris]
MFEADRKAEEDGIALAKSADSDDSTSKNAGDSSGKRSSDLGEDGSPIYHPADSNPLDEDAERAKRDFRKKLNRDAREAVAASIHRGVRLIVHRPDYTPEDEREYDRLRRELQAVVREITDKALPLLEHEISAEFARKKQYGGRFAADSVANLDFRHFAKKRPPTEAPSLAVALRVDESASMAAHGRLAAAKRAVAAVYDFCRRCGIPIMIYGDTADASRLEQMSVYAYADLDRPDDTDRYRLMKLQARSNNRDGMAIRILGERLAAAPQQTKLLISISDGQPKAMDDYAGEPAIRDMRQTIAEFERKGVKCLAAAIGQDKEVICRIYGNERYLDMSDLKAFRAELVRLIARFL